MSTEAKPDSTRISGVLHIEGASALPWAAAFLRPEDALATETAFLLAEHRSPEAVSHLIQAFHTAGSNELGATLLTALAATRLPEAYSFLLNLIAEQHPKATPPAHP